MPLEPVGGDRLAERHRRHLMHDHAVRIDEDDGEFRVRQLLVQRGHFEPGARDQVARGLAAVDQFLLREYRWHHEACGI
jgi:hypothetical protein